MDGNDNGNECTGKEGTGILIIIIIIKMESLWYWSMDADTILNYLRTKKRPKWSDGRYL